ncbi:hypothetical protein HFO21_16510 [Rhizobium laguerreae]|uniref:competence protein CoiA family protein n=1 Tax=Rhizobium laguerreae TaxID=1076926 RepID=UPI001C91F649|nr:hypothetical protein [Rhizobium laguerreae]MBY3215944.1 hypothetical protein [Rhizobium laguerreae]
MGQVAYTVATGSPIEAFSTSDEQWAVLRDAPRGSLLMPKSRWPACAKTSIRGLRFFAHHPGYTGVLPAPESYAHTRLKVDIVKTLRALGFNAHVEVSGRSADGEEWVADVLADNHDGSKVAFEIQFSSQHLDDFRLRTARYARSGVRVCWFMPERPVNWRITKAIAYENATHYRATGHIISLCEQIISFSFDIKGKNDYPEDLPPIRIGYGNRMLTLTEAVAGMMAGMPRWKSPQWQWGLEAAPS